MPPECARGYNILNVNTPYLLNHRNSQSMIRSNNHGILLVIDNVVIHYYRDSLNKPFESDNGETNMTESSDLLNSIVTTIADYRVNE